ncbi:MAG: pantetheine-phosphate adenylyltransferase [Desulfobacterales bacterium]|nr:pantetheine-phosphate adenylyltransferase [Desulfobacterales bacterium]
MNTKIAIYPGSFDPITNGHVDIIERSLKIFDKLIIAILHNPNKTSLFSVEERIEMIKQVIEKYPNVEVDAYYGLVVDYAHLKGACSILRGMRAVSDFEYEFQMALMNRRLNRDVQTFFMMTGLRWIFTSSSIIKEAAKFGGDISSMVPDIVNEKLREKFKVIEKNE